MKMQKFLTLFVIASSLALAGCPKKPTVDTTDSSSSGVDTGSGSVTDETVGGGMDSDSGNAMGMQTIHFPYDSFEVVGENKEILKNNVKILKDNPTVNVQLEGHCDERGGVQYNLALGEKRANAVKQQILAGGIAASRVTTISMGKEKPIVPGSSEDAWAKNRRANFVITSK